MASQQPCFTPAIMPLPSASRVAYRDGVGRVGSCGRDGALARIRSLGIRPVDLAAVLLVLAAQELTIVSGGGYGAAPLTPAAGVLGGVLVLPILFRHRWPVQVLISCSVLLLLYYSVLPRRNISPAPLLALPLYDTAVVGYLVLAIVIPAFFLTAGLIVVAISVTESYVTLVNDFLPSIVVLALAVTLGETVRSRRALAAETAAKLKLAEEERDAEAAARVAQERLRIARELHDTVAHSMSTITVQAGSALHVLGDPASGEPGSGGAAEPADGMPERAAARQALTAIRDTSKVALADMRLTLGQLRTDDAGVDPAEVRSAGLDRLDALSDAVRAAGAPVSVRIDGAPVPLPPAVDHAAYRILQESLTNVLRHAGPDASAAVRLGYTTGLLTVEITDDGCAMARPSDQDQPTGHGVVGMTERARAIGGTLTAGPRPAGGYAVIATLPLPPEATP
jgi:signal transduction histidine kinase